jgi:hypothetical protein
MKKIAADRNYRMLKRANKYQAELIDTLNNDRNANSLAESLSDIARKAADLLNFNAAYGLPIQPFYISDESGKPTLSLRIMRVAGDPTPQHITPEQLQEAVDFNLREAPWAFEGMSEKQVYQLIKSRALMDGHITKWPTQSELEAVVRWNMGSAAWMCDECSTPEDWMRFTKAEAKESGYAHKWSGE